MLGDQHRVGPRLDGLAGTVIPDTGTLGLDAMFPAVILALVLPALRDRRTRRAAATGAVLALLATPFLPAGLPVLLALAGPVLFVARPEEASP
ncbi:hypothetical protein [Sphaerimonospora mesophila]|uniref:hypothetical protein n=1 Tax=Sphaerimonospora mesophila TaxID=37483 RepID=UPI000B1756F9